MKITNTTTALILISCLALLPGCSLVVGKDGQSCTDQPDACGEGMVCGPEGTCIKAECIDECSSAGSHCDAELLMVCSEEADGCLHEAITDCTLTLATCVEVDDSASCESPCTDECDPAGSTCTGDSLVVCSMGEDGCLDQFITDCTESGGTCVENSGSASCQGDCTNECDTIGSTCDGDTLQVCSQGTDGCRDLVTTDCTEQQTTCVEDNDTASCDGACINECNTVGNTCEGDTAVECTLGEDSCLDETTTNCADNSLICLDGICDDPTSSCDNGLPDGHETDLDCGGYCEPCADDLYCITDQDCQSDDCDPDSHTCQSICQDTCNLGDDPQCNGTVVQTCQEQNGCYTMADGDDCAADEMVCQDGQCMACDPCFSVGETECLGSLARNCVDINGDQCWVSLECSELGGTVCSTGSGIANCIELGTCNNSSCNSRGPGFSDMSDSNNSMTRIFNGGQPVVDDPARGLMWQGCLAGLTGDQCTDGSMDNKGWSEARDYCRNLSWGPTASAPYDDWYLPDRYELQSILQYQGSAWLNANKFPASSSVDLWTSNSDGGSSVFAWVVDSGTGQLFLETKEPGSGGNYVRCVRRTGPAIAYSQRFTMDGVQQTITDEVTGLVWQRCTSGYDGGADCTGQGTEEYPHPQASTYCTGLNLGVYPAGWRLPTAKELNSIVDDSRTSALDEDYFFVSGMHDNYDIWTSDSDFQSRPFFLDLNSGQLQYQTDASHNVRCVHDP